MERQALRTPSSAGRMGKESLAGNQKRSRAGPTFVIEDSRVIELQLDFTDCYEFDQLERYY